VLSIKKLAAAWGSAVPGEQAPTRALLIEGTRVRSGRAAARAVSKSGCRLHRRCSPTGRQARRLI
jgi:hypothetical protein